MISKTLLKSTGKVTSSVTCLIAAGAMMVADLTPAHGAVRGSEFDTTVAPAAGGMEGVAIARPQDPIAHLFANPATLTQFEETNAFTLGAAFVSPFLDIDAPTTTLTPSGGSGRSRLREVGLPHAAVLQRINESLVVGVGFTAISELGGDFRNTPGLPSLISDFKMFGANAVAAYQLTERLSFGAGLTVGIGSLELGLTSASGVTNAFGLGGTGGITYDTGPIVLGLGYKTPVSVTYREVVDTSGSGDFENVVLEQPREVQIGFATSDALFEDTLIALDLRWKNYSDAQTYQDIWKDLYTISLGGQHTMRMGAETTLTLRGGYSYHSPLRLGDSELGSTFAGLSSVGGTSVTPTFLQLAQGTVANGYWQQSISIGFGFNWRNIQFDANANYGFDGEETEGPFESEGRILTTGFGLTWKF